MTASDTQDAKGGGNTPAIAIFVFGRKEYAYAAQHLAVTLREMSPGIPVHLWAADGLPVNASYYTEVHRLDPAYYEDGPGLLKLSVHDILPLGDWLYLDADTLCIADLRPYIEALMPHDFALEVRGKGKEADKIPYTPWATNATVKRIAGLPDDADYYGVQTSWMWIRKGAELPKRVFDAAWSMRFKPEDLKEQWGGSIPDELCVSAALSKTGITPHSAELSFYGALGAYKTFGAARAARPLACLYGDTRRHRLVASSWLDQYDRYIRSIYRDRGGMMGMGIHSIMKNKHVSR